MSSGSIRIIQLPEKSSVNTDDYMAVDSSANGTKKVKFTDLLDNNLSVRNKAADAQATGEAINDISVRVDNMINTQTNAEVTTLWTGTLENKNQSVTLSESIANFDFIDIYGGNVDEFYLRKPVANTITFEIQSQNFSDDASVQFIRWWETGLRISGTTATITKCIRCYWDDFSQVPVVSQATAGINITRIDGVKIGHVENDEIVDARVGYDGTEYPTLGDAIRGSDLEIVSKINNVMLKTGYTVEKSFSMASGTSHSSDYEPDRLKVLVPIGKSFQLKTTINVPVDVGIHYYAEYSDGTKELIDQVYPNEEYTYKARNEIIEIGVYVTTVSEDVNVNFSFRYHGISDNAFAYDKLTISPIISTGSSGNPANPKYVTARAIPLIDNAPLIYVRNTRPVRANGNYFRYTVCAYKGETFYVERITDIIADDNEEFSFYRKDIIGTALDVTAFGITIYEYDSNNNLLDINPIIFDDYPLIIRYSYEDFAEINKKINNVKSACDQLVLNPTMSNGSGGNPGNPNGVTARAVPLINNAISVAVKNTLPVQAEGNYFVYDISAFRGTNWYTNRITNVRGNNNEEIFFTSDDIIYGSANITGFGVTIWEYNSNGVIQTIRKENFDDYPLIVRYIYDEMVDDLSEIKNDEVNHKLLNARHATNPLTLLHFSDIHEDTKALARIVDYASKYTSVDNIICTGDMVANTAQQISSWWDENVMTCIGNHDSASYSGGAYNWTALSMADRDVYYIAPFESNWDIVHTSGTSYYYKDYATQKIRLIVMDGMLYNDNGAEATAQTAWLSDLLDDAITNNLHVLIAIHAPHGGSSAEACSFSKYNQGEMPTYSDCNTPQVVIDTVASAISSGLHFIGYIVGHTHQDNIWDAESDGKQLMYCVTCANTDMKAQWNGSDQDRSHKVDAFNLITIDTNKTLIKIIRGGGADIDDHMRTRRAICFNYSTGEIVGEVL